MAPICQTSCGAGVQLHQDLSQTQMSLEGDPELSGKLQFSTRYDSWTWLLKHWFLTLIDFYCEHIFWIFHPMIKTFFLQVTLLVNPSEFTQVFMFPVHFQTLSKTGHLNHVFTDDLDASGVLHVSGASLYLPVVHHWDPFPWLTMDPSSFTKSDLLKLLIATHLGDLTACVFCRCPLLSERFTAELFLISTDHQLLSVFFQRRMPGRDGWKARKWLWMGITHPLVPLHEIHPQESCHSRLSCYSVEGLWGDSWTGCTANHLVRCFSNLKWLTAP